MPDSPASDAPISAALPHTAKASPGHLRVDGLSRSFPDRRVLTDISLVVNAGEVACLIGENGSGKTTLLRTLAGLGEPDAGTARVPGTVGLCHQEPSFPAEWTVGQILADATKPLTDLVTSVTRLGEEVAAGAPGAGDRLAEALDLAERHQAWDIEHRVERVVEGLGIKQLPRTRGGSEVSGGNSHD